ncbi:hypothetical protein [Rubrivirga sp.]|uniref:hypothetical protein n=1 Tax=Rubrivirga sp. TaxID=1885344 RepID=UPI003B52733B
MRPLLFLAALALAGCDALSPDSGPTWAEAGAVAVFDYEPGPDSLRAFVSDGTSGAHRTVEARARGFEMAVVASERWRRTDRHVVWRSADAPGFTSFGADVPFPLDDEDIEVVEDGIAVVVDVDCTGGGWVSGGSRGRLSFVRAPNRPGTLEEFGNCQRSYDLGGVSYPATGPEPVTVPAGTVSAIRVERPLYDGGTTVEWWSWEAGLVRLDVLAADGTLRGRFVRSAGG